MIGLITPFDVIDSESSYILSLSNCFLACHGPGLIFSIGIFFISMLLLFFSISKIDSERFSPNKEVNPLPNPIFYLPFNFPLEQLLLQQAKHMLVNLNSSYHIIKLAIHVMVPQKF